MITKDKMALTDHVKTLSDEARKDMADGRWDEVMTDALYADCGAETVAEMAEARRIAEDIAKAEGGGK